MGNEMGVEIGIDETGELIPGNNAIQGIRVESKVRHTGGKPYPECDASQKLMLFKFLKHSQALKPWHINENFAYLNAAKNLDVRVADPNLAHLLKKTEWQHFYQWSIKIEDLDKVLTEAERLACKVGIL